MKAVFDPILGRLRGSDASGGGDIFHDYRTEAFTAANGGKYICSGTFAITNPASGGAGQAYQVIVLSGAITINSVAYAPSRFPILVAHNGSSWQTLPQTLTGDLALPGATFGSNNALSGALGDARYVRQNHPGFFDDFDTGGTASGSIGRQRWAANHSGGSVGIPFGGTNGFGITALSSGATTNNYGTINAPLDVWRSSLIAPWKLSARVRLRTTLAARMFFFGFSDRANVWTSGSWGGIGNQGIVYDSSASANWRLQREQSGLAYQDIGVAAGTDFVILTLRGDGADIWGSVNGSTEVSFGATGNSTRSLNITSGTLEDVTKTVDIDWVALDGTRQP